MESENGTKNVLAQKLEKIMIYLYFTSLADGIGMAERYCMKTGLYIFCTVCYLDLLPYGRLLAHALLLHKVLYKFSKLHILIGGFYLPE